MGRLSGLLSIGLLALGLWLLGAQLLERRARRRIGALVGVSSGADAEAPAPTTRRSRSGVRLPWRGGDAGAMPPGDLGRVAAGLASALRVGRTLTQGLEEVAADRSLSAPTRTRIGRVLALRTVGVPLDRALESLAGGQAGAGPGGEAALLATVLQVGRRAGTGLPGLLDEFATAMRDRETTAREVRSMTVQARLSGTILCLLPVGFFGFVALTSARDVLPVLASPAGVALLVVGFALQGAGALWVRGIVRVEG